MKNLHEECKNKDLKNYRRKSKKELYLMLYNEIELCDKHSCYNTNDTICFICSDIQKLTNTLGLYGIHTSNKSKKEVYRSIFSKFYFCDKHDDNFYSADTPLCYFSVEKQKLIETGFLYGIEYSYLRYLKQEIYLAIFEEFYFDDEHNPDILNNKVCRKCIPEDMLIEATILKYNMDPGDKDSIRIKLFNKTDNPCNYHDPSNVGEDKYRDEIWKTVPGRGYLLSNYARLRLRNRNSIIKLAFYENGDMKFRYRVEDEINPVEIDIKLGVLAQLFVKKSNPGDIYIDNYNGDKSDIRASNLRWVGRKTTNGYDLVKYKTN